MEDARGNARAARCLGVMDNACAGLQWEVLVFVLLRASVCNILAGTSLMQRRHIRHENSFAMLVCSQVILRGANGDFSCLRWAAVPGYLQNLSIGEGFHPCNMHHKNNFVCKAGR